MRIPTKRALLVSLASSALIATGCATTQAETPSADLAKQLTQKDRQIGEMQSQLQRMEKDMAKKDAQIKYEAAVARRAESQARTTTTAPAPSGAPVAAAGEELFPPNARPGECYARAFIPPTYKSESEKRLKRQASARIEVIPARYEKVEEKVLVKEASQRLETVPAQYDWVEEKVLVKEASSRLETVPAKYDWVEEKVLVEPAHTKWKKGRGPTEKMNDATGEIMCLIDVPAAYKTVKKRVVVEPPKTRTVAIPAEYKTLKKRVMVKAPTTRTIDIPAEYKTVTVTKMVSPPKERRIEIPAEYETVTNTAKVTDGRMSWRPVLCETNMNPGIIRDIQRALKRAGHNPGPIDGVYGWRTQNAVRSFQKAKTLPTGGLTIETIKALGVRS